MGQDRMVGGRCVCGSRVVDVFNVADFEDFGRRRTLA